MPAVAADVLVAIDAGTSGARCLVARPGSGTLASVRREWSYDAPPEIGPLGRSFDAETFWPAICAITRQALLEAGVAASDVAAVGVTSQRLALLIVDGEGRALYAGPNSDVRALMEGLTIDGRAGERVYASSGKLPSLLLAPARVQWLRTHDEAGFARAAAVLALGDWVAYRLTGVLRGERSLAGDCGLLDVTTCERDEALLSDLDVPLALLPPLVSSSDVAGEITSTAAQATGLAAGTPVVIAGADTQCALLGMGIEAPGEIGIVAGWSGPVMQVTAQPQPDAGRRTWLCVHVASERWLVESSTHDTGQVWRWWCEALLGEGPQALEEGARLAAQAPPGAGGAQAFLGPGPMNAGAMGMHLGGVLMPTPITVNPLGRPELLRAVLENIAYAFRANVEQAQEVTGLAAARIALGGGLTKAGPLPQIVADVLGAPVEVAREVDVSARGATMLAARAVGLNAEALRVEADVLIPEPAAVESYRGMYDRWSCLRQALDRTMQELP